jgi:copper chaperone CopZ
MQAAVHIETIGPFCPKCDSLIESTLRALPGVSNVRSNFAVGLTSATIEVDEIDPGALTGGIRECGFDAHTMAVRPLVDE